MTFGIESEKFWDYLWNIYMVELFIIVVLTLLLALKISGGKIW